MHKLIKKYLAGNYFAFDKSLNYPNTTNVGALTINLGGTYNLNGYVSQFDYNPANSKIKAINPDTTSGNSKNFFSKMGGLQGVSNIASNISAVIPKKPMSAETTSINSVMEGAENIPGPVGMYARIGNAAGNMLNAMGIGTDLLTTTDKLMDSHLFKTTPLGLINSFFTTRTNTLLNDASVNDTLARTDGGYGGFMANWENAQKIAGKKVGFFNSTSGLNSLIDLANNYMTRLLDILGLQKTNDILTAQMEDRWNQSSMNDMNGGFGNISFGRRGFKITQEMIDKAKAITSKPKTYSIKEEIIEFQTGGKIPFKEWYKLLPKDKNNMDDYDLEKAYNELSIDELEAFRTIPEKHLDGRFKKSNHPTYDENQDPEYQGRYGWFGSNETGWEFRPSPRLMLLIEEIIKSGKGPVMEALLARKEKDINPVVWYKEYWDLNEPESTLIIGLRGKPAAWLYSRIPPNEVLKGHFIKPELDSTELTNSLYTQKPPIFKDGGSINVIPEGALHARLHHMEDADGLTKKGIPVVSIAEGGEIELQAEIELNEIIFRLEVTKELEKLMEDGSENAAIEAGKLLVKEIFENTDDRTGLIEQLTTPKEDSNEKLVKQHRVV